MPPNSDDPRTAQTIVPDRGDMSVRRAGSRGSHAAGPSAGRRPPRVWPLWCLILLLGGALAAGGWQYWQDRHAFESRLAKLNQRLDATGNTLDASGESLRGEFDRLRGQLEATRAAVGSLETRVAQGRSDDLETRLSALKSSLDDQQGVIAALQTSLSALESTAKDARATLATRLQTLSDAQQQQATRLAEQGQTLDENAKSEQALVARVDTLAQTQKAQAEALEAAPGADLSKRVDQLRTQLSDIDQRVDDVAARKVPSAQSLEQLRSAIAELRQGQTGCRPAVCSARPEYRRGGSPPRCRRWHRDNARSRCGRAAHSRWRRRRA